MTFSLQIIEEARRILLIQSSGRLEFMKKCVERLEAEFEMLIYFGVEEKRIEHSCKPLKGTIDIDILFYQLSEKFLKCKH